MPTLPDLLDRLRELQHAGALDLPLPGKGATALRHDALMEWGERDLSLARIAEAHTDALAILAEASHPARPDSLYGVWAADGPGPPLTYQAEAGGELTLQGTKSFCSGATFLDAALVTAHGEHGLLLIDVDLHDPRIRPQASQWATAALDDTATVSMEFGDVRAPAICVVGGSGWYLSRPGFWHGAVGPAACWAGGALSLVGAATRLARKDPHSRAHVGGLQALGWALSAYMERAGREIDADPTDSSGAARIRALKVRHLVERTCTEVLDRFGRATGPQLLAHDAHVARQYAGLTLYVRQCHAERDLETIPEKSTRSP